MNNCYSFDYQIDYKENSFRIFSHQSFHNNLNENIDFHLEVKGKLYWGSAFTIKSIINIMRNQSIYEGEICGTYFWSANFIIIEKFSLECLIGAVRHLVQTNEYSDIFYYVSEIYRE